MANGYIVDDGDDLVISPDDVALEAAGDLDPLGRRGGAGPEPLALESAEREPG